jgi:predicted DNA-binding protein
MGTGNSAKTKNMNIRASEDELLRFKDFARFQGKTLSRFAIDAMWEQIEEWEDLSAVKEYIEEKKSGKTATVSHGDFMAELGLR